MTNKARLRHTWSKRVVKLMAEGYKPLSLDVAVDFDGTICKEAYPSCGPLLPKARWGLLTLKALGAEVVIFSCRSHKKLRKETEGVMVEYLKANGIHYDRIERGYDGKPLVGRYFDDRSIPNHGKPFNWPKAIDCYIRSIEAEVESIYRARQKRMV